MKIRKYTPEEFDRLTPREQNQFFKKQPRVDREKVHEVQSLFEKQSIQATSLLSEVTESNIGSLLNEFSKQQEITCNEEYQEKKPRNKSFMKRVIKLKDDGLEEEIQIQKIFK